MKELVGDLSKILKFTIRSKGFIRQESVGVIERCERAGLRAEQSIYLWGVSLPLITAWEQHFKILCRYVRGHSFSDLPVGTEKASSEEQVDLWPWKQHCTD